MRTEWSLGLKIHKRIRAKAKQHTGRRKERLLGDRKFWRVRPRSGPARKSCRDGVASLPLL